MNDEIKREDFEKKQALPSVMIEENKIQNEVKLGNSPRCIDLGPLFLKLKKREKKKNQLNNILHVLN